MPKTLLVLNYCMDETDQALSHQVTVVNRLASYFDQIYVITGRVGECKVNKNVLIVDTQWIPNQNIRNVFKFYRELFKLLKDKEIDSVFSHMSTIQSLLSAPIMRLSKKRHVLWYAHKSNSLSLSILKFLVDGFVTSTAGSFPFKSKKLTVIGQGIDEDLFRFRVRNFKSRAKAIHIGRFDPSKNNGLLIKSIESKREMYPNLELTIIGNASNSRSIEHKEQIISGLSRAQVDWVHFKPAITRVAIPEFLSAYDFFIHGFIGSLDKILIECTLVGIPVISINPEYLNIFGGWNFATIDSQCLLEEELAGFLKLSEQAIEVEVNRRYKIAVEFHTLNQWIVQLVQIL